MQSFKVEREHIGDKPYRRGDLRKADTQSVAHLVRNGVLSPIEGDELPATVVVVDPPLAKNAVAEPEPEPEPVPEAGPALKRKASKEAPENK